MIGSAFEAIQNLHYVRNLGATSCPFPTFGGSLSSLLQPLSGPSPFFVALRGNLFAFSWKSFLPLATFGGSLSSLLQPLRGPSPFLVALRGNLFPFSWKSFLPFPTFGGSLSSLLQPLSGPSPFFVALRGNLFPFSWKSFLPCPTFGGSLSSLLQPLSGPSPFFVALRGYLFAFFLRGPSWIPFVDIFFSSCLFVVLRAPSCPFVDPFVDNRDNVPSLQAAPGTFPHLC